MRSIDTANNNRTVRLTKRSELLGQILFVTFDVKVIAGPRITLPLWRQRRIEPYDPRSGASNASGAVALLAQAGVPASPSVAGS